MFRKVILCAALISGALLTGCASVPMANKADSNKAKEFNSPPNGTAGLYIYRTGSVGGALKKDVLIDGKCIGETAPDVFFYEQVKGDEQHKVSTESEFSPNDLLVDTRSGKNYYIHQYIKMGLFVGGANLELVSEDVGKKEIAELGMAIKGTCSQ